MKIKFAANVKYFPWLGDLGEREAFSFDLSLFRDL